MQTYQGSARRALHGVLMLLVLAVLAGCHSSKMVKSSTAVHEPAPGKAMVVFLRSSGLGGAIQSSVYDTGDQDTFIGIVSTGYKTAYQAEPGHHRFMVQAENADFLEADVDAGKTYYVLVSPRIGWWKARFSLLPIRNDPSSKQHQVNSAEFREWMEKTSWVDLTPDAEQWYREHAAEVREKKLDYLKKWAEMAPADKAELTLHREDGV